MTPYPQEDSSDYRCGHNFKPSECPYRVCGYRNALELVDRYRKEYLQTPVFETFCKLKHGVVGEVLTALQNGAISRGKAAECLAEIAHGATSVVLPDSSDLFSDSDNPEEVVTELRKDRERLNWVLDSLGWGCSVGQADPGDFASDTNDVKTAWRLAIDAAIKKDGGK